MRMMHLIRKSKLTLKMKKLGMMTHYMKKSLTKMVMLHTRKLTEIKSKKLTNTKMSKKSEKKKE